MSSMLTNVNVKKGPPLHELIHYFPGTKCTLGGVPVRKNIYGGGGLYIYVRAGATGGILLGACGWVRATIIEGTWISVR